MSTLEATQAVSPSNVEILNVLGATLSVLCTPGRMPVMVGEQVVPSGYVVPPHVHDHDDELFFVLEGFLTVINGDGETTVGAGACVQLPRGVPHSFRNDSAEPARHLVIALPGQQALEMFRHFDRLGRTRAQATPADIASIASQYGTRFA